MLLRLLYDDQLAEAAYLIGCQRTGEAILIDPERDIDRYLHAAASNGVRIMIPPYMSAGERIIVDTTSGEYVRRAD